MLQNATIPQTCNKFISKVIIQDNRFNKDLQYKKSLNDVLFRDLKYFRNDSKVILPGQSERQMMKNDLNSCSSNLDFDE